MLAFNVLRVGVLVAVAVWVLTTPPSVAILLLAAIAFGYAMRSTNRQPARSPASWSEPPIFRPTELRPRRRTPGDHGRCSDRRVRRGARRPCRMRVGERPDLHRGGRLHRDLAAPALPPRPRGEGVRAARHRPRVHPSLREAHDPHARDRTVGVESGGRPGDRARTRPPCSRRGVGRSGGRALRSAPRSRRGAGGRLGGEVAATSRARAGFWALVVQGAGIVALGFGPA